MWHFYHINHNATATRRWGLSHALLGDEAKALVFHARPQGTGELGHSWDELSAGRDLSHDLTIRWQRECIYNTYIWLWIKAYENSIFRGMNIHKNQLFWCELQGYYWFWHTAIYIIYKETIRQRSIVWNIHREMKTHSSFNLLEICRETR